MTNLEIVLAIIKKITMRKQEARITPSYALFVEILRETTQLDTKEIKETLNALCRAKKLRYGCTINNTYFELID